MLTAMHHFDLETFTDTTGIFVVSMTVASRLASPSP
jgi:hypothetical protein